MAVLKTLSSIVKVSLLFYIYFVLLIAMGFKDYNLAVFSDLGLFFVFVYIGAIVLMVRG